MDIEKITTFALFFPGFLFSLSFHEAAHGWVANRFGDTTAKDEGRITLNPVPHTDPIGTLVLPTAGYFLGGLIIGWGKPVPIDYRRLKDWKRDGLFIAAAGPLSNFILALLLAAVIHGVANFNPEWFNPSTHYQASLIMDALQNIFLLNLALTFFNLVPIHPLDGGKILYGILPQPYADRFDEFAGQYGTWILLGLFVTGTLGILIGYPIRFFAKLLFGGL